MILVVLSLHFIVYSCKSDKGTETVNDSVKTSNVTEGGFVEVITQGMDFRLPDTLNSGWTKFKYVNKSVEPHFFILEKLPDSLGIQDYKRDVFPPFIAAFEFFEKGDISSGMKEFEKIPEWFYRVELCSGVGLTSPQSTSVSTVNLEPGTYVMECYVRMPNGMAHTFMGMLKEVVVIDTNNAKTEPKANNTISLSSNNGIRFVDSLKTGYHKFSVDFIDQKQYEHMMGHDVNLVKIENDSSLTALGTWLNAADIKAFRSPAPKGVTFLGGVQDLPAAKRAFFEAYLTPGNYVLISEIPQAIERNMYKTFKVY